MKLLWIDVETTGLNREKCDIIQIAGIVVINGEEKERFNLRCQPVHYENIEPTSFKINGWSMETLKELPLPQQMYLDFISIIDKYIDRYDKNDKFFLAGQNVQFDLDFLKAFFEKMGDKYFGSYFFYKTVDLMALCTILHTAGLIKLASWKLVDIAKYLNIEFGELHDAVSDVDLTRKCFCKLILDYIKL